MSQTNDFDIANQPGNTFRAELNEDLQALVTQNAGEDEPGTGALTAYPYMLWVDTNFIPPLLKQRNGANNGWVTIGYVGTTAKTALFANNAEVVTVDGATARVGIGDTTPSYTLDVNGDINCTGTLRIAGNSIGNIASNVAIDPFSGNGSAVAFVLSQTPVSINNVFVFVSGVYQPKSTYSLAGNTITFSSPPPTGSNNIQIVTGGSLVLGTPSDGTVTVAKLASSAYASQVEAEAGTENTKIPTVLRIWQAIAAWMTANRKMTQVYQGSNVSLTTGTSNILAFNTERFDDGNWHDNVTNNSRITVDFTGRVRVTATLSTNCSAATTQILGLSKNGGPAGLQGPTNYSVGSLTGLGSVVTQIFECAPGDYFQANAFIISSGTVVTYADSTTMTVERIK